MTTPLQNQAADKYIESENYSLGTVFGTAAALPTSAFWVADFFGAAFFTGASWPAVLSISSSKLSAALFTSLRPSLNALAPALEISRTTFDNFSAPTGIFLSASSSQSNNDS